MNVNTADTADTADTGSCHRQWCGLAHAIVNGAATCRMVTEDDTHCRAYTHASQQSIYPCLTAEHIPMPHSRVALYATWIHMGSHMCHEYRQRLSRLWLLSHAYMAASQPHSRPSSQPHKLTASQAHSRRASQPTILTPLHPHNLIADHPHILSPSKSHTLTISQPYRSRSFCVRSNSCGAARVIDGRSGRPCVIPCQ